MFITCYVSVSIELTDFTITFTRVPLKDTEASDLRKATRLGGREGASKAMGHPSSRREQVSVPRKGARRGRHEISHTRRALTSRRAPGALG